MKKCTQFQSSSICIKFINTHTHLNLRKPFYLRIRWSRNSFVYRLPKEILRTMICIDLKFAEKKLVSSSYWCSSKTVYQCHLFGLIIHPIDLCPFGKWSFIFPARTLKWNKNKQKNNNSNYNLLMRYRKNNLRI